MNPSTHPELYSFYASPGLMTTPGAFARLFDGLPTDIPALCKIVQGLLTYPLLTELYGIVLTPTQKKEVNIRPAAEMLERIHTLDSRSLSEARPPNERLVGNCRDHTVLLCTMLRHQGRPARARCGFAAYLGEGLHHDHWVTEVWDSQRGAWFLVDPQIDDLQRAHFKLPFDPAHLPPEQFYTAARAWALCRKGKAKSRDFGVNKKVKGWPFMRSQLLRELAALNKIELLPWDNWWPLGAKEEIQVTAAERKSLDHIAAAINGLDEQFDELRILYDDPDFSNPLHSRLKLMGLTIDEAGEEPGGISSPPPLERAAQ